MSKHLGGAKAPPFFPYQSHMEHTLFALTLTIQVFTKVLLTFAPFVAFGAVGMALVEKIHNLRK